MIRILTQNGVENTNIDGARDHHFNAGNRSGIVKGVLNEGRLFSAADNAIDLDTCELRVFGHRIVIDAVEHKVIQGLPESPTEYSLVASLTRFESTISFELIIQLASSSLLQDNISNGNGTYQMEIGNFVHNIDGSISDIVKTARVFCGSESTEVDDELSDTSENPVQNKVVKAALDQKQDQLSQSQIAAVNSGITSEKVASYDNHTESKNNPHEVTKAQVDLGNVDNTSDLNKPISTATQTALDGKQNTLTFDNTPTAGSSNPVTSAGIKSAIDSAVSSVYKYKGSVATYDDLPTTDLTVGDVYNVEATGDNYAWTGTAWDKLAGTIDLSGYQKKMVWHKYDFTTTETVTDITYNLVHTNTKVLYLIVDKVNTIPTQTVKFFTTVDAATDYQTGEFSLLSGLSKEIFFMIDLRTPVPMRQFGSFRYTAYNATVTAASPFYLNVTSFTQVKLQFNGDGIPSGVPFYIIEGVEA